MIEAGERPAFVGAKVLWFIGLLLGWSLLVGVAAVWWWAVAPLPAGCGNSAAAQHVVAEREGIGGECTQAAIDRTKHTLASSVMAWSAGAVVIVIVSWGVPRLIRSMPRSPRPM